MAELPHAIQETSNPAADSPPLRRRRFQFSLLALLWLTTLVACLAAVWGMYRDMRKAKEEVLRAREELEKYRGEMGYLDVVDRGKLYARGVTASGIDRQSWRVYIPDGARYWLYASTSEIPRKGFPASEHGMTIDSGEHLINLNEEERTDRSRRFFIKVADGSGLSLDGSARVGGNIDGVRTFERKQVSADLGSRLVLLRSRKDKVIQSSPQGTYIDPSDPDPCDGLMIWIEPEK